MSCSSSRTVGCVRSRSRAIRMRRALAVLALMLVATLGAAIALGGCGSSGPGGVPGAGAARAGSNDALGPGRAVLERLLERRAGSLPAPLQDAASVSLGGQRWALLGGLDASDTSTAAITILSGTRVSARALLPEAQHDAQAALLGGEVYVFGGGQFASYDHIIGYRPGEARASVVGQLPRPASDVAVASIGGTAYIVGGYDGRRALDTILAWRPGQPARLVARLPVGLRYTAVAAAGSKLTIAGGSTEAGATAAILSFDPATRRVTRVGSLPQPLAHASAVSAGETVVLFGGRGSAPESQSRAIIAIDSRGRARPVGELAEPLSDAAGAVVGGHILLAGGQHAGETQAAVFEFTALHK